MTDERGASLPEGNYVRPWRDFRGLTQEQLAERAETTPGMISMLERGERQLTAKWLRKLGLAMQVPAGFLLDHHPDDLPTDVLNLWAEIPEDSRSQALKVLSTFRMAS